MAKTIQKQRPMANHSMLECEYFDILEEWISSYPAATISSLLGPLVMKEREVSTTSLVRITPLLQKFVEKGQDQCVLLGSRLENAILRLYEKRPNLKINNVASESAMFAQHVMVTCKVMRSLKREEYAGNCQRRYPKTGHLRRRLTPSDWCVIRQLLGKMVLPRPEESMEQTLVQPLLDQPQPKTSQGDSFSTSSTSLNFGAFVPLPQATTGEKRMRSSSPASTVVYDDDGFPVIRSDACSQPPPPPPHEDQVQSQPLQDEDKVQPPPPQHEDKAEEPVFSNTDPLANNIKFDSDGWPIFSTTSRSKQSSTMSPGKQSSTLSPGKHISAADDVPIVTPKPRGRKEEALRVRSTKKMAAAGENSKPVAKIVHDKKNPENVSKLDDMPFARIMVSKTTEKNARYEICAAVNLGGKTQRVHVCTLTKSVWGDQYFSKGEELAAFCKSTGATKSKALALRNSWTK